MKNIWPGSAEVFWLVFIITHVGISIMGARLWYVGLVWMGVYFAVCIYFIVLDHRCEHNWKQTAIRTLVMVGLNLPWTIPRCLFH
jgi:hypothetical protein